MRLNASAAEALPLYQTLRDSPTHGTAARFAMGRILLGQDDPAGIPLLNTAMQLDADFVKPGLAIQQAYYRRQGNYEAARQLSTKQYQQADLADLVYAERLTCTPQDILLSHNPTADALAPVYAVLAEPTNRVVRAWLLRKQLYYLADEKPFFILLLRADRGPGLSTDEEVMAWSARLAAQIDLPGTIMVVPMINRFLWIGRRGLQIKGSEIYSTEPS